MRAADPPLTAIHESAGVGVADRPALTPQEAADLEVERRFERIHRARRALSLMLLPPLLFFIFIVVWFHEGFILIPIGGGLYLYMLAEFFVFQNPVRRAHRREAAHDETQR